MNPDLYTDEYRSFRFLQSKPEHVAYFKEARSAIDHIQPWDAVYDPKFSWPCRIEFTEQLLDLRGETVYIVSAGLLTQHDSYEEAHVVELVRPVILTNNPILYKNAKEATTLHVGSIEHNGLPYCLTEGDKFERFVKDGEVFDALTFRLNTLPIVPHAKSDFIEMFYDKDTAEKYRKALTDFLRNKMSAMSAFSARL
jgi:hypothetical protein